jgi:hypothetical protein
MEDFQRNRAILSALVTADNGYAVFAQDFPADMVLSPAEESTLLAETLDFIQQSQGEKSGLLFALRENPDGIKTTGAEIAVIVGVAFLLRTHFKLQRNKNGEWTFLAEHKPGDTDLLGSLLSRLQAVFSKR